MKILSIQLQNFLSFGDLYYEYGANGLTSLDGEPGAGKSSFLDGVSYAFFGIISKNVGVEEIINRKAGKNLYAKIRFEYQGKECAVVRCRKHSQYGNDVWIECEGVEERGKDSRETDKLILQKFDLSYDIFQKSVYFSQFSKIDAFLSSSDTAKKELISDIGGLQKYDVILDKVKRIHLDLEKESIELDRGYSSLNAEVNSIGQSVKQTEAALTQWNDNWVKEKANIESGATTFEAAKQTNLSIAQQSFDAFEAQRGQLVAIAAGNKERFETERLIRIANTETMIKTSRDVVIKLQSEIQAQPAVPENYFESLRDEWRAKLTVIRTLEIKRSELAGDLSFNQRSVMNLDSLVASEQKKLAVGTGSTCSNCHQDISLEKIQAKIDSIIEQKKPYIVAIELLNKNIAAIDQGIAQRTAIESKINQINQDESAYKLTSAKNRQIQTQIDSQNSTISMREKEIYSIQHEMNPHTNAVEMEKMKPNPHQPSIDRVRDQVNPFIAKLEHHTTLLNPHLANLNIFQESLKKKTELLNHAILVINALKKKMVLAKWWKEAFGVYIRSYLMDSFIQQINEKSNEYLEILFDGKLQMDISTVTEAGKDLKEKISIKIFNGGDECSYDSLSGGERCRICLSVNLAISDLARGMSTSNFNILMIDEAFNGLNEEGKNQTMKLLKELEERFDTIFVIDHTETFKSMFTNRILVVNTDGYSSLLQ